MGLLCLAGEDSGGVSESSGEEQGGVLLHHVSHHAPSLSPPIDPRNLHPHHPFPHLPPRGRRQTRHHARRGASRLARVSPRSRLTPPQQGTLLPPLHPTLPRRRRLCRPRHTLIPPRHHPSHRQIRRRRSRGRVEAPTRDLHLRLRHPSGLRPRATCHRLVVRLVRVAVPGSGDWVGF